MTNEQTNEVTKDMAEAYIVTNKQGTKATKSPYIYSIAFALVKISQVFQYRSTKAVKVDKTHAVLIPSGKYVEIDKMKIVKVRG